MDKIDIKNATSNPNENGDENSKPCPDCGGSGKTDKGGCKTCGGTGVVGSGNCPNC